MLRDQAWQEDVLVLQGLEGGCCWTTLTWICQGGDSKQALRCLCTHRKRLESQQVWWGMTATCQTHRFLLLLVTAVNEFMN